MKFRKGDRIAFYKAGQARKKGTVESTGMLPGYMIVVADDCTTHRLHPKQCRKLKPKKNSIHYEHDVVVYVPCYQDDTVPHYPTFHYSYVDATIDEQMCLAAKPDYVLVLRGKFDAKTK